MPRYEHNDDKHIVLKLKSGQYWIRIEKIEKIEKKSSIENKIEKNEKIEKNNSCKYFVIINWWDNCK